MQVRFVLSGILFCLITGSCLSQDRLPPLTISADVANHQSINGGVQRAFMTRLAKKYTHKEQAFFELKISVDIGKIHSMSGMENYSVANTSAAYTISKAGMALDSMAVTKKMKATNRNALLSKVGKNHAGDRDDMDRLTSMIDHAMKQSLTSCASVSERINGNIAKGELDIAYDDLGYYGLLENCGDALDAKEKEIVLKHEEIACARLLQKAEILANSGDAERMQSAIDMLLFIPPEAGCAERAIEISQLVFENAKEIQDRGLQYKIERLQRHRGYDRSAWKDWYRYNIRDYDY